MKHLRSILFFLVVGLAPLFASGVSESSDAVQINDNKLVVYTTKSFGGEYGPGPKIAELFKASTNIEIEFVFCKEGVLNRSILEGKNTQADVLVGIDNHTIEIAKKAKILQAYRPKDAEKKIDENLRIDKNWLLTPFDYGYLCFMFDTKSNLPAPQKLSDLTKPEYKAKIVIFDPRTSTTGLGFVAWVEEIYKDKSNDFWKALKPNVFLMARKWSEGYPLLTKGEVPLAFSYTSSLAAHILYDKTERFQPLIFDDGHMVHIEGMGVSAYSKRVKNAKAFIDFMLTEEAQNCLPETQFMYPILKNIALPKSYTSVPQPKKILRMPTTDTTKMKNSAINELQK